MYRLLLTLGFPFLIVYVLIRGLKDRRYFHRFGERFGFLSFRSTIPGGIWLHAVSVGEVILAVGFIRALKAKFPGRAVYVSCGTLAGRAMADQRLAGLATHVFYAPFDYPWIVRRVLRALRPSTVIVLETEIWPNFWRESKRFGANLYVVNGRISDRALPKYRSLRWAFAPILRLPDAILTQSERDRERYMELGARNPVNVGNLKYDFAAPKEVPPEISKWAGTHRIFIAASTMPPDEDDTVIAAYRQMPQGTRMLLAPRKPERFDEAAAKLSAAGIDFVRWTQFDRDAPVLLLDTIGELASTFALDSVVFMGGSIVTWGGHNVLEPAFFGRPILTGPYMQNFAEIDAEFRAARALRYVNDANDLAAAATEFLRDSGDIGERARKLAESKRGATQRAIDVIEPGAPLTQRPFRWFFWLLSRFWLAGVWLDRKFTRRRRLSKPVISVGGLAMGGVGKTPFVLWLAEWLHRRGRRVGILTRGYGRKEKSPAAYAPGSHAPIEMTGDEAQLYLKAGTASVGIGADRFLTAGLIEKDVDVFILDDGFQHWALDRDLDLVLIDPIDPYAGGGVFPAGQLREDFSALKRADLTIHPRKVVLNPPLPGRYSAICGIGNPASFRQSLETLDIEIGEFRVFPDHHKYSLDDFDGLEGPIIATEKDAMNFPPGAPEVYILKIGILLDDVDAVLARISHLLG